jgi:CBS domain-containing protein
VARCLKRRSVEMQSSAEHTGLPAGQGGEQGRAAGRGDSAAVDRWAEGRAREGESRVFSFVHDGTDGPRVGDVPLRRIPVIAAHLPIAAARRVAALKRIALLLVERDDQLVGVVEESVLAAADDETQTARVMKPLGLYLRPSMSVAQARELFIRARATVLPVIAGGFVLGAVTRGELERAKPRAKEG